MKLPVALDAEDEELTGLGDPTQSEGGYVDPTEVAVLVIPATLVMREDAGIEWPALVGHKDTMAARLWRPA